MRVFSHFLKQNLNLFSFAGLLQGLRKNNKFDINKMRNFFHFNQGLFFGKDLEKKKKFRFCLKNEKKRKKLAFFTESRHSIISF
jgi:hypothetical protein